MTWVEVDRLATGVATVPTVAEPQGEIVDVQFWNPNTGKYEWTPPNITVGQTAGLSGYGRNTSDRPQNMRLDGEIISPSGKVFPFSSGDVSQIQSGYTVTCWHSLVAEEEGEYRGRFYLYAEVAGAMPGVLQLIAVWSSIP